MARIELIARATAASLRGRLFLFHCEPWPAEQCPDDNVTAPPSSGIVGGGVAEKRDLETTRWAVAPVVPGGPSGAANWRHGGGKPARPERLVRWKAATMRGSEGLATCSIPIGERCGYLLRLEGGGSCDCALPPPLHEAGALRISFT